MWSRAIRRPLSSRLHRTVRFSRKYNGQHNNIPHTTYFQQPPPKPDRPPRRLLRSTLFATTFFGLGLLTTILVIPIDVMLSDEDPELAQFIEGQDPKDIIQGLRQNYLLKAARGVPALDLLGAQVALDTHAACDFGPNFTVHGCALPSNMPTEDRYSNGSFGNQPEMEKNWQFFAVFDGHAGPRTADFLTDAMPRVLGQQLLQSGLMDAALTPEDRKVEEAIKKIFNKLDTTIMGTARDVVERRVSSAQEPRWAPTKFPGLLVPGKLSLADRYSLIAPAMSGSCALVALFDPSSLMLRVANIGDSRAVLGTWDGESSKYVAKPLTTDQTGFNADEVARIEKEHPSEHPIDPKTGRLQGLAVTRAFGDARWKWPEEVTQKAHEELFAPAPRPNGVVKTPPYLTADPEVTSTRIREGQSPDFLILASDGLWDHISSSDAVECVQQWLKKYSPTVLVGREGEQPHTAGSRFIELQTNPAAAEVKHSPVENEDTYFDAAEGCMKWRVSPKHFIVEDDNAATHLVKNALGGKRRNLFCGVMSVQPPTSRKVRDDITVQVIFFGQDVYEKSQERFEQMMNVPQEDATQTAQKRR